MWTPDVDLCMYIHVYEVNEEKDNDMLYLMHVCSGTSVRAHIHTLIHSPPHEYVTVGTRWSLSLSSLAPESVLWARISAVSSVWWVEVVCILSSV